MKKLKLLTILLLLGSATQIVMAEENVKPIKSKLNEATVFLRGAELTHTATASLNRGDNEIRIEGLSPNIDLNSLKIKAGNGVVISAFEFSVDDLLLNKPNGQRIKAIEDSIVLITEQLDRLKAEIKIDSELTGLMKRGTDRNIADTISVTDLMKVMEYYQSKSTEIEMRQIVNRKKQKDFEKLISDLNTRFRAESSEKYERSGVLKLNASAQIASSCTFTISYYTSQASWIPYYDINIKSVDKPIDIVTKAKVRQTTTVDWSKVKLTLSTSTPSAGKQAPLFSAWFLQYIRPLDVRSENYAVQNSISYEREKDVNEENTLSEVVVTGYGTKIRGIQSIPNASPLYIVDGREVSNNEFNALDPRSIKNIEVLKDASATTIYGSRAAQGVIVITLNSMDNYVTANENDLDMTFNIDLPYTIPGNGKEQSIQLRTQNASATYKYYCAPKLDRETFLLAEISGWEKLGLMSGKANVTYDDTYIGETYINASSTQEALPLTLGTDKRVSVKRELVEDSSSKKTFGNDIKQVFTYKITVKNNQNKNIKMVLKDQYPKSTSKELQAELLLKDTTPPSVNKEEVGVLTWEEDFTPGEVKTYYISYSIKYPKDKEGQVNIK